MIILNGKKFAANGEEFTNSLFERGGTCAGYYKATRGRIVLFDSKMVEIGGINKQGVLHSTTVINGKKWHSYAPPPLIGEHKIFSDKVNESHAALRQVGLEVIYA